MGSDEYPDLYEASVLELQDGLEARKFSSVDLVKAYFSRIDEVNLKGPALRAIIETNPSAISQAAVLDEERKTSGKRSPLHGIPVLVKDNISTIHSEGRGYRFIYHQQFVEHILGMNTTAGSFSLLGSVVPDDAGVVKRLRRAGAIILGKANLSEWSLFRGKLASGWSGRGGQCTNAYYKNADPCGSSAGSGVAASIGLATVTLGTETDGSITCPSSNNNIVGIKPTVGLTSRAGVIPITTHQDTVGPMARCVSDAAIVLSVIAGKDPNDKTTLSQPEVLPDFTEALNKDAFREKRIGVPRRVFLDSTISKYDNSIYLAFEEALNTIRGLGATVVDPADMPSADEIVNNDSERHVMRTDFKIEINAYFKSLVENPSGVRSLADLIAFNNEHADTERPTGYESQIILEESEETRGHDSAFFEFLSRNRDVGATRGIDAVLKEHNLDAIVLPARGRTSNPAALAGYPIVTVPLGFFPDDVTIETVGPCTVYPAPGVPFGLSFLGTAFSEFDLIGFAYAYEQKTRTRHGRRAYAEATPHTQLKDIIAAVHA